ncbi:DUF6519 domain-containing protein [Nocardia sp. XZ_19_231]|uniref:DUF6519 domain-containing protein n=1 Tax=Nocardia sp. XZ_19_231 TaxID=2769252 RepID=UPI001890771F|nr:DUF6519 domain-containing protein [Nocardia sp. XZ_19_231]
MKGDFTRDTFDPRNHYTRVFMQQGRVQVDADWNEQASIAQRYLRVFVTDVVGQHGGPAGDGGFQIAVSDAGDLTVGVGRYYVQGLLCENENKIGYTEQPSYPFEPTLEELRRASGFLLYLDVWERHVSYLEAPGLREVALGGPDTATRSQLVWQVRALLGAGEIFTCAATEEFLACGSGLMRAKGREPEPAPDACVIDPEARYRGAENQLYRVEIHRGGPACREYASSGATFKWSRENGSVAFPILQQWRDNRGSVVLTLGSVGRDARLGLKEGDWVELSDDATALAFASPPLLQVASVDRDEFEVVLTGATHDGVGTQPDLHPVLRRWDHDAASEFEGALPVRESSGDDGWIDLEDGIRIQFATGEGPEREYRTGDYWLVPARTATGDVEWPWSIGSAPDALPPRGVVHHYAPLAEMAVDDRVFTVTTDCRRLFAPLENVNGPA